MDITPLKAIPLEATTSETLQPEVDTTHVHSKPEPEQVI